MKRRGKLYGLGVGPGDLELITLKAIRILKEVDIVFASSSSGNEYSLALQIVRPHLSEKTPIRRLPFPMTMEEGKLKEAWRANAGEVIKELYQARDAAFVTIGDPLTYSTYGYLVREVQRQAPETAIETIPGITSYQAAAASANVPLVEAEESLYITSGRRGGQNLPLAAKIAENIVLLKAYRHFEEIYPILEKLEMVDKTRGFIKCGLPGEEIIPDIREMREKTPHYLTLLLAKEKGLGKKEGEG